MMKGGWAPEGDLPRIGAAVRTHDRRMSDGRTETGAQI